MKLTMKNGLYSLEGKTKAFYGLNVVQMSALLQTLNYPVETLFDCIFWMEEKGHNTCHLGICGGFMWSSKEEV